MKRKIIAVLPFVTTALIMFLIIYFSSQTSEESAKVSTGITKKIVDIIKSNATEQEKKHCVDILHHIIRKIAHFTLYAALGFSASGMFVSKGRSKFRVWIYTVIYCAVFAASDEFHQSFVDGRGAMVSDVVLDSCGGCFGAAVFAAVTGICKRLCFVNGEAYERRDNND